MTLNDVMTVILCFFSPNSVALGADYVNVVEDRPYSLHQILYQTPSRTVHLLLDGCPRIKLTLHLMRAFLQVFCVSLNIAFNAIHNFAAQLDSNSTRLVLRLAHISIHFTVDLFACRTTELAFSVNFCKEDFFSDDCCIWNFVSTALNKACCCSILQQRLMISDTTVAYYIHDMHRLLF